MFCRSASGRALTGHHKLDRSISGPLSLSGGGGGSGGGSGGVGGGGGSKQQAGDDFSADDLEGPTVQAQDEDGLSEAEVSMQHFFLFASPFIFICFCWSSAFLEGALSVLPYCF